jgi:hypothetical protein
MQPTGRLHTAAPTSSTSTFNTLKHPHPHLRQQVVEARLRQRYQLRKVVACEDAGARIRHDASVNKHGQHLRDVPPCGLVDVCGAQHWTG